MNRLQQLSEDYYRVERAIEFIERNRHRQPSLKEIALSVDLSEFHFQRLFSRWVGISPKRFLQFINKEYAKKLLSGSANILDVTHDTGLSSGGRLHDLFITCEAITPGEYKSKGEGLMIYYGFHPTPFGKCLLALTARGICALRFIIDNNEEDILVWLKENWERAILKNDPGKTKETVDKIFNFGAHTDSTPLHLFVKGTNFQIKVWEALLKIPFGKAVTYEDVARHIGMPTGSRAVGNAVGSNYIPFLIPCHRVIKKLGDFGNYGGGRARKKALLGWEAAKVNENK